MKKRYIIILGVVCILLLGTLVYKAVNYYYEPKYESAFF